MTSFSPYRKGFFFINLFRHFWKLKLADICLIAMKIYYSLVKLNLNLDEFSQKNSIQILNTTCNCRLLQNNEKKQKSQIDFIWPQSQAIVGCWFEIWILTLFYIHTYTVLPSLVRKRTIRLMSFSGFVLIERAYYTRGRTIQLFTSWPISEIYFSTLFVKKTSDLEQFLQFLDIFEQGNLDLE